MSFTYPRQNCERAANGMNHKPRVIQERGERRQLNFATGGCCSPPAEPEPASLLTSVEHHRDIAMLVGFQKAQVKKALHLAGIRQPPSVTMLSTRMVINNDDTVEAPRSHTRQLEQTFVERIIWMSNIFTAATPHIQEMNTHSVELTTHKWRVTPHL